MEKGKLYLVRHGESMGNVWPEAYRSDERNFLSPYGVMQAKICGHYFKRMGLRFDHLYSSNLLRARQTMITILQEDDWKRPWTNLPSLNEVQKDNEDDITRVRDVFYNIFQMWKKSDYTGNVLIVSHYHTMQVIFDNMPVDRKDIASHNGQHVGNGQPFLWDPDKNWCIEMPDLTKIEDQH